MNLSIRSLLITAAVAAGTLGAAMAANAATTVQFAPGQSVYVQQPGVAYGEPHGPRYERDERRDRDFCGAPRWNPQARYMPGNMVRHQGKLYVARRVSGRVYNVNSPPAQTPNYWARARC
ncbi:MAG: hypothetical protein V4787_12055 [Pseudomonadota bacterium]